MKPCLPVFITVLLAGCTSQPGILPPHDSRSYTSSGLHAIGARNPAGLPVGDYRIVNAAGNVQAQGRFQDGKMEGKWVFFDSRQVKVAEVDYRHGVATGPYKTYFGSAFNPSAAGKLESTGFLKDGQVVGEHLAYSATGVAFSKATFQAGHLQHVETGPNDAGPKTAVADEQFVRVLEGTVHSAVQ